MSNNICRKIEEHERTIRTLIEKARSAYTELTKATDEEEKVAVYNKCDAIQVQISKFKLDKAHEFGKLEGSQSCIELLKEIEKLEKDARDLNLKFQLRLAIIAKEISRSEQTREDRLEDLQEEIRVKMWHLQNLGKELNKIYHTLNRSMTVPELKNIQSHLNSIQLLLQCTDTSEMSIEDAKVIGKERETLLVLTNYLNRRVETRTELIKEMQLLGSEKVANRLRPHLTELHSELQRIMTSFKEFNQKRLSADYLQRAEWLVEGIDTSDYQSIPELCDLLREELAAISHQSSQIKQFLRTTKRD